MSEYSLNPAHHLLEVDFRAYNGSRLFRSSLGTRCLDTFVFLSGAFHGELFEETGGQVGLMDFFIPHYFSYRLLSLIMKANYHGSIFLEILSIMLGVVIGLINIVLSLLQKTIVLGLFLLSLPAILIVDALCQSTYNQRKNVIKDLIVFTHHPHEAFPLQELINPTLEIDDSADIFEPQRVTFKIGKVVSYKEIFSTLNTATGLVENNGNLYIEVSHSESDKFIIPVDPTNPEPLRNALALNIFGITRSLEKSSQFAASDLQYVENALSAIPGG